MSASNFGKDIKPLTGLRGIAAIYVVSYHYIGSGTFLKYFGTGISGQSGETFFNHGYLAVDLFFVLSGFVMALNYRHMFERGFSFGAFRGFLGRRIARVYPIYFLTTTISFLLIILGLDDDISRLVSTPPVWALKFVVNATLIQTWGIADSLNDPAWSLSAEWAAYMLFPALLIPCLFRAKFAAWLAALSSIIWLIALWAYRFLTSDHHSLGLFNISSHHYALPVLRCLPEFTLGILSFRLLITKFGRYLASSQFIPMLLCVLILCCLCIRTSDLVVVLIFPILITSLAGGGLSRPLPVNPTWLAGRAPLIQYLLDPYDLWSIN